MRTKYAGYPQPEPGQLWASADPRDNFLPRPVIQVEKTRVQLGGHRRTWVRRERMRPIHHGYRLCTLADGTTYTGNEDGA